MTTNHHTNNFQSRHRNSFCNLYSPIQFAIDFLIFNRTIVENFINITNKKSFSEIMRWSNTVGHDQIYHKALRGSYD